MSTASVIVVSYNTREKTLACLASLAAAAPETTLEVIVVDNGSADGSAAAIRSSHPDALVVESGQNLGFARGVNLGVRHATAQFVLLLNPDTVALPGSLDALVAFAVEHPAPGLYGGQTLRPDGTVDPSSCWGEPTLWSLACFASGASTALKRNRLFDPESLGAWNRDSVRHVPIITGCLLLVRRENWDALGGMDEDFFLYGEDAEFSSRARRAGLAPVIVPAARIVHEVGGSTASSGAKMCMVMAGKATLLAKTWSRPRARLGIALLAGGAGVRAALETATGASSDTWRIVWRRRTDWNAGYPRAEATLFGRPIVGVAA